MLADYILMKMKMMVRERERGDQLEILGILVAELVLGCLMVND